MVVSEETQQRLLETAGQVFAEKGFQGATVREICARAEANVAAVNYYFGDKERLYIEAVKYACVRRTEEVPLPPWPAGTPPEVKLRDFVGTLLTRLLNDENAPWHLQLILREMAQPTAACAEWVRDYVRPAIADVLRGILSELLPPDVPPEKRHLIGFSIVGQCLFYKVHRPVIALLVGEEEQRRLDIARLADHIAQFTLAALGRVPTLTAATEFTQELAGPADVDR